MLETLLLSVTGPIRAFSDSDSFGQFIVILQLAMSVCSWAMMVGKGLELKDVRRRSAVFVDKLIKRNDILDIYAEVAHDSLASAAISEVPMGKVYMDSCKRLAALVSVDQRQRMAMDPTYRFGLTHTQMNSVEAVCAHAVENESVQLSGRAMTFIAIFTSAAPLFGLLGTVWGVMLAFQSMAASGSADIAELAPGISSALLTTVVGLVVAIPSTIGYNLLQGNLESRCVDLEGFGEDLMGKLRLNYLEDR
jgi:biopolymer transport protein ExbB/TolQ